MTRSSALVCAAFAAAIVGLPVTLATYVIDHRRLALLALAAGSSLALAVTLRAKGLPGFAAWLLLGVVANAAIQFSAWHHALRVDDPAVAAELAKLPDALRQWFDTSHKESDARRAWLYGLLAIAQALPLLGTGAVASCSKNDASAMAGVAGASLVVCGAYSVIASLPHLNVGVGGGALAIGAGLAVAAEGRRSWAALGVDVGMAAIACATALAALARFG